MRTVHVHHELRNLIISIDDFKKNPPSKYKHNYDLHKASGLLAWLKASLAI